MEISTEEAVARGIVPNVRFDSLYTTHHPRVLGYFLRRFDRDTAVDCAAEVFTVAWRRIEDVPDGDQAIRWLYGVCRNVGWNEERSGRRSRRRSDTRRFVVDITVGWGATTLILALPPIFFVGISALVRFAAALTHNVDDAYRRRLPWEPQPWWKRRLNHAG